MQTIIILDIRHFASNGVNELITYHVNNELNGEPWLLQDNVSGKIDAFNWIIEEAICNILVPRYDLHCWHSPWEELEFFVYKTIHKKIEDEMSKVLNNAAISFHQNDYVRIMVNFDTVVLSITREVIY